MSANNMSDEELDKLFRESAEHYTAPFDEEAWTAMEQKLDGAQGGWAGMKRFLPIALLTLIVTVAVVWNPANRAPTNSTAIPATTLVAEPEVPASGQGATERVQVEPANTHTTDSEQTPIPVPDPERPAALHPAAKSVSARVSSPERPVTGKRLSLSAASTATYEEPLQPVETVWSTALPDAPVPGIARREIIPETTLPAASDQAQERSERVFLRSMRVALVVAPDLTTVRFKDPDAVSTNAGVLFSVPITRRLSLVSGAVWANKRYNATPADYAPSPDYWDGKKLPDVIAAQCKVLDIPVNLQYQVLGWGKNALSVQAGLSSYLMLKEDYTYTYTYTGREPYSKTREFTNENRHWFGIQNVSVGYTHQLSPAISIGAEPFVKIPLASIGEGRVKLTSAGVFFTAGYTLK